MMARVWKLVLSECFLWNKGQEVDLWSRMVFVRDVWLCRCIVDVQSEVTGRIVFVLWDMRFGRTICVIGNCIVWFCTVILELQQVRETAESSCLGENVIESREVRWIPVDVLWAFPSFWLQYFQFKFKKAFWSKNWYLNSKLIFSKPKISISIQKTINWL